MPVRTLQNYTTKNAAPIYTNNASGLNNRGSIPTDDYTTKYAYPDRKPKHTIDPEEVNTQVGEYRKCINHHIFELLSMSNSISSTVVKKDFGGVKYQVSSVDGESHTITLFTNKLWDLILLKLTELVECDDYHNAFVWDDRKEWDICMSIKTIADCLGLSDKVDSLTHFYDRIVTAANVLRNVKIGVNNVEITRCNTKKYRTVGRILPLL